MLKFNEYVNWQPPYTSKNYNNWIENLKDNGVTRQRYWGCPMPIWECEKCGHFLVNAFEKKIYKPVDNTLGKTKDSENPNHKYTQITNKFKYPNSKFKMF